MAAHRVDDLIPVSVHVKGAVGDGQAEELPLALSLHQLAGELGDPRRVGGREEPQFIH